ncbi:hypothetical protein GCM10007415_42010 [Parapedobacter pyrenivorans]|uniref:Thioredoxin domain-containing protein n=1 Tax=Parapedobacter pyrenivorans TaxID=1305674 RepID=A0A917MEV0_9SPHI|nr:TlpA disulfide reductase family protein [Parapedobacter pyrenivorans]GGH01483.1 hypothetical protein GCM10007415_42010 [Parapedobacter pyrenivorans]
MKRFLRVGERYALSKIYSSLLAVATIMCLYAVKQVSAQEAEPASTAVANVKPLQIRETIPEYLWHLPLQVVNHPRVGGKDTITLNEYRDKLIILDFWATWCKPCISSLYKLDTLQKQFTDQIAVIPTTYEAREKAGAFIANKGWSLPSAVGDIILKKYFPHQSIPHQVWIKSGRVEAIVGPEYARADVIDKILQGQQVDFSQKSEVAFDAANPLFLNGNGGDGSNMLYQSVISGRLQARVAGAARQSPNAIIAYNQSVENLYCIAFQSRRLPYLTPSAIERYIKYEIDDSLKYRVSSQMRPTDDTEARARWAMANVYCYNLVLPKGNNEIDVDERMVSDLNHFFESHLNLTVTYEKRKVKVLALVKTEDYKSITTRGGESYDYADAKQPILKLQNKSLYTLIDYLNVALQHNLKRNPEIYRLPLVDESGIDGNVDLSLEADLGDLESIRKALRKHGLNLVEKFATINMIVFKNYQHPKQKTR